MMRSLWIGCLLGLMACGSDEDETTAYTGDGEVVTQNNLYHLKLVSAPYPHQAGQVQLSIQLSDNQNNQTPVTGATLQVTPLMPDMGHGINEDVQATESGNGDYLATWSYSMAGQWELTLDVDASMGTDKVIVTYDVE